MIFSLTGFSRASGAFVLAAITLAATLPLACMKADDSRPPTTTASTPAVEKLRQAIRNGTPEEKEKALERFADEKIVELVPDVIEAIADPTKLPEHGDTGWGFVGHEAGTLMVRISADYDGVPYQQSGYTNWSFHNDSAGGKELQESGRLDEVRANWRTWWAAQKLRAPGAPAATIAAQIGRAHV